MKKNRLNPVVTLLLIFAGIVASIRIVSALSTAPVSTPTLTETSELPVETSSITLTPTEIFSDGPTFTFTPTPYKIVFNGFINCRSGPGDIYPTITTVRGQEITILARDSVDQIWLLVQVDGFPLCWLSNNVLNLPEEYIVPLTTTDSLTPRPTFTLPPGTLLPGTKPTSGNPQSTSIPSTIHPTDIVHSTDMPVTPPTRTSIPPTRTSIPPTRTSIPPTNTPAGPRACNDGIDNDGDGNTDFPADPDCRNNGDDSE